MFVAVMVSVSCNNDDDDNYDDSYGDSALVGTWGLNESEGGLTINVTATFNENLSGTLLTSETFDGETEAEFENFTWSTDGNKLRLKLDGETEKLTYSISGDTLTVTDEDGETTVLTRQ
jgi:uncharacterized lipoprotein NlpE involved in copper resistance